MSKYRLETIAVRGDFEHSQFNEHNPALFLTSSFKYDNCHDAQQLFLGNKQGYTYSRTANPTVASFEKVISKLEGAQSGQATSTGMSAILSTFLTFLKCGDHLIVSKNIFGTTIALINTLSSYGIDVTYVSLSNLNDWKNAIRKNTKLFFLEAPSNPLCETVDIQKLSDIAHENNILVSIDNTFCSPAICQPIKFGVDLVIHSATKVIDGHGRVFGGIIVGYDKLIKEISNHVKIAGEVLSPFNAWVLLSGVETLFIRMQSQCSNALKIANYLETHPKVEKVYYPFLEKSNSQYTLAKKQQTYGGIIISFKVIGNKDTAWDLINNVQLFSRTGNLGDVKSTITHPFTTTHAKVDNQVKLSSGITENLIRISIGLEHYEDLINDLDSVLNEI